ncbi:Type 1 glutamine amidotransferase-like domain-containing protein [Halalkalicoccus subterraneus]|uniref:Type 1 glutamine amidotransferase-like domain-containing protein n=1 Tax=Halalkalicoccus subterraneus TaxID=2675002 RepID=UPI000EFB0613|nr:peptidase E [Halalkalicoccus subterraneus]
MTTIVAIGGGEIAREETKPIDQYICDTTDSKVPRALFVPTASGDAVGYRDLFDNYYGDVLGCQTRHLVLHDKKVEKEQIYSDIDWADVVYVGGGSLPLLISCWREYDVDQLLYEAYQEGTIMAGLSAGAMCWFASGLSDSIDGTEFTLVECLNWIENLACTPHATSERRSAFQDQLRSECMSGIALEDGCAIEITDDQYRILSVTGEETAYSYRYSNGSTGYSELYEEDPIDVSTLL